MKINKSQDNPKAAKKNYDSKNFSRWSLLQKGMNEATPDHDSLLFFALIVLFPKFLKRVL